MRLLLILLTLLPLALTQSNAAPARARLIIPRGGEVIDGSYLIKFKKGDFENNMKDALKYLDKPPKVVYPGMGFAADISEQAVELLRALPSIDYIEQEAVFQPSQQGPWVNETISGSYGWNLGRISHRQRGNLNYTYDKSAGANTCVYVIDSGINVDHVEFQGRATWVASFAEGGSLQDSYGHGTHVAGIVGSKTWGVAKRANLFAVKVLDKTGRGITSAIISGLNITLFEYQTRKRSCPNGVIVNFSIAGPPSQMVDDYTSELVSAGIFVAVAAGNYGKNASEVSPARNPDVFTVSATDENDNTPPWADLGRVVDIFAPGADIVSTWASSNTALILGSGTSQACPHIAGLAAYLQTLEGWRTPAALGDRITGLGRSQAPVNMTVASNDTRQSLLGETTNLLIWNGNVIDTYAGNSIDSSSTAAGITAAGIKTTSSISSTTFASSSSRTTSSISSTIISSKLSTSSLSTSLKNSSSFLKTSSSTTSSGNSKTTSSALTTKVS